MAQSKNDADGWRWDAFVIIAASTVSMGSYGILSPLLSERVSEEKSAAFILGILIAVWSAAIAIASPVYPRIVLRVGTRAAMSAGLMFACLTPLAMLTFPQPIAWIPIQAIAGFSYGLFWVSSEMRLLECTPKNLVGRVSALYGIAPAIGVFMGSVTVRFLGVDNSFAVPLVVLGLLASAAFSCFMHAENASVHNTRTERRANASARLPSLTLAIAAVSGIFESVPWGMLYLFSITVGRSDDQAVTILNVFFVAQLLLAWHLGKLADRFGPKNMLSIFSASCIMLSAFLYATSSGNFYFFCIVVFFWSAILNTFRSIALASLAVDARQSDLAGATAKFVMFASVGEAFGPPTVGYLMDTVGPAALPVTIALFSIVSLVVSRQLTTKA